MLDANEAPNRLNMAILARVEPNNVRRKGEGGKQPQARDEGARRSPAPATLSPLLASAKGEGEDGSRRFLLDRMMRGERGGWQVGGSKRCYLRCQQGHSPLILQAAAGSSRRIHSSALDNLVGAAWISDSSNSAWLAANRGAASFARLTTSVRKCRYSLRSSPVVEIGCISEDKNRQLS